MESINQLSASARPRPAIFLDRDGTLIEDVGIVNRKEQIKLFPDTIAALQKLQEKYLLFVITNQSGIANGLLSMEQAVNANNLLNDMLKSEGVHIEQWYICPHCREDNCSCIKPKPEFVLQANRDYNLDLSSSFVIGDHPHDVFTANEYGVFGLYLLTGHGGRHISDLPADKLVFHRISDAAEWLLSHPKPQSQLAKEIQQAVASIVNGGVAAFPTETVYGLGADVFQPEAVEQIFKIKGRPHYNPLIAHIYDISQLEQLVTDFPETAKKLCENFWPGPLTIVLSKRKEVPDIVTGGHNTVAVRMPANPIALEVLRQCNTPLAAPSANRFTCTSPTTAGHVKEQLGEKCKVIIDGGSCRVGLESTVISFTGSVPTILRPGGVSVEEIESIIGKVDIAAASHEKSANLESPGMIPNHYAPKTTLRVFNEIPISYATEQDIGILLFQPSETEFSGKVEILSQSGSSKEAASNFFAALCRLDKIGLKEIIAEYVPDEGLGRAINNRLSKASKGRLLHNE